MINLKKIFKTIIKEQLELKNLFLSESEIGKILNGYLFAILFFEEGKMLEDAGIESEQDEELRFSLDNIDKDSIIEQYAEIKKFLQAAGQEAVMEYLTFDYGEVTDESLANMGHDIWVTRNKYGGGFDNDWCTSSEESLCLKEVTRKKLKKAARSLGEAHAILGDAKTIYIE